MAQNRTPALAHQPYTAAELPSPGLPMTLEVTLLNSKDSNLRLRAFVTRDGKLIDVIFRDLTADLHDRLLYVTTLNAPLVELSYQFFLYRGSEVVASSDRYLVRRDCIPNVDTADPSLRLEDGEKRLESLRDTASRLQSEVQNYENVLGLIDELQSLTARPAGGGNEN